jgi:hypothetical protein
MPVETDRHFAGRFSGTRQLSAAFGIGWGQLLRTVLQALFGVA